ncbi:MAG: hypothetical protein WDW38_011375 [Sanguina aurantia]
MEESEGDSFYAVLNVSRDASTEDVRRAYRNLAQVFHPDKQLDPSLKGAAQETFGKLQQAHEILSDTTKRQIYDVYGKQGLSAGFEVGPSLTGLAELKKQWEEFKRKQEADRQDAASNHRGSYMCRVDATEYRQVLQGRAPLFRALSISNSVDAPLGEGGDVVTLQGQAALRNQAGTGNLIFGYHRVVSAVDSLDMNVILGLRPQVHLISSRQLSPYTSASLATSYGLHEGWGLHFNSTRQLPFACTATFGWVLGPKGATGMSLSVARRGAKFGMGGKGVLLKTRYTRAGQTFEVPVLLSAHYQDWRMVAAAYVMPPLAYVATSRLVVRPLSAWLRDRRKRSEQAEYADEVNAGLRSAAVEQRLLGPVARRKARVEAQRRTSEGLVILTALYGVLDPGVIRQHVQTLVGASATPGTTHHTAGTTTTTSDPHEGHPASKPTAVGEAAGGHASGGEAASPASAPTSPASSPGATGSSSSSTCDGGGDTATATSSSSSSWSWWRSSTQTPHESPAGSGGSSNGPHTSGPGEQAAGACSSPAPEGPSPTPTSGAQQLHKGPSLPDQWMDVTAALQYLVTDGRLVLHPGVAKSGLMGFADPAPAAELKRLYVAYWHQGKVWEVEVDDEGGLQLPGAAAQGPVGRSAATATASTAPAEPRSNPSTTPPPPPPAQPTSPHQQQQQQQQQQTTPPVTTNAAAGPATGGTQGQCVTDADLASQLLRVGAKTWGMDVSPHGSSLVMSATESGSSSS